VTNKPPAGLTAADYDTIESAVMETARGRWFLIEYDRRRRAAETAQLLEAVTRLERAVGSSGPAALEPPRQAAIAGPVAEPRPHVSAIGERLQDIAWNMRERGFDDAICGAIEEQARLVLGLGEPASTRAPALAPASAPDPRLEALARIDRMPLAEKLALFI
jgi:hypothetical protein